MSGTAEPLLGDIRMFYERCKVYGVEAIYDEAETMAHVYMTLFQGDHAHADRAMAVMASFVQSHLIKNQAEQVGASGGCGGEGGVVSVAGEGGAEGLTSMRRSRSLGCLSSVHNGSQNNLMDLIRNPELQQQRQQQQQPATTTTPTTTTSTTPTTTTTTGNTSGLTRRGTIPLSPSRHSVSLPPLAQAPIETGQELKTFLSTFN